MDKKLTHCHKPWMDISKGTNGNDFPKKYLSKRQGSKKQNILAR